MKRIISFALFLLVFLGLPLMALAEEITTCAVTVDSIATPAGKQITVPVRITANQGFTNFAISMKYDHEKLKLISIQTEDSETPYPSGTQVSINDVCEDTEEESCGYVVLANADALAGDRILFTATFLVDADFKDTATVTPVVHYFRNNSAVFSIFEEITASVTSGTITAVMAGDINANGVLEYDDVMMAYKASLGEVSLTEEQKLLADINGDQKIDHLDVEKIYEIYTGGK